MDEIRVESDEEVAIDPVCGRTVDLDDSKERDLVLEYEGRTYTFCGSDCRSRFEHRPMGYSAAGRAQP